METIWKALIACVSIVNVTLTYTVIDLKKKVAKSLKGVKELDQACCDLQDRVTQVENEL